MWIKSYLYSDVVSFESIATPAPKDLASVPVGFFAHPSEVENAVVGTTTSSTSTSIDKVSDENAVTEYCARLVAKAIEKTAKAIEKTTPPLGA